ncbi:THAP domain-containing protein 1 A-like [Xenia sp. Carnegie-2017]|uniref:THAP domain-containing protein 1 A-like n=1 Tax=Xenia sp. Carnegie-2017 TaxID=2897299 RepID=UPI001F03A691|nr:THAP domain-containing protein 1 A-like [Xenia sp. Carnegie-2017]
MPNRCSIVECRNVDNTKDIAFHSFPDEEKNPALFSEWVNSIKKWSPLTVLTKWSRVCSDHFSDSMKRTTGNKVCLEDSAVPTLFQQVQDVECTESTEKVRKLKRNITKMQVCI